MLFYFLGFVLALVTIFGLVHSQPARENLHLQNLCVWSSSTVRRQLHELNIFGLQRASDGNQIVDIVEIGQIQVESASGDESENSSSSEPIEEIQGIKLGAEQDEDDAQKNVEADVESSPTACTSSPAESEVPTSESRDSVLSAINASLRRLSSAANSGRLNGTQLYQILLRETLLHEKTAAAAKLEDSELSSIPSTSTLTIESVESGDENNNTQPKTKMYFGETPMDYVPHQQ